MDLKNKDILDINMTGEGLITRAKRLKNEKNF